MQSDTVTTFKTLFGDSFISKDGTVSSSEIFANKKYVALYFSAHWCGPCRRFTPVLSDVYASLKSKNADDLEIIFISSDQSEEDFKSYFSEMPWYSVPYTDTRRLEIKKTYPCNGIPTLSLFNAEGKLIRQEADPDIDEHGDSVISVWNKL